MKRSEMLTLITDIVAEVCYREIAEKRANKILDVISENGMLPPMKKVTHISDEWTAENALYRKYDIVFQWDAE